MTKMLLCKSKGKLPTAIQMNECDLELKQLVLEIQASTNRKNAVIRRKIDLLFRKIFYNLAGYKHTLINRWSGIADIESIVSEAVNNTFEEALKNIDRYDPKYSVMQWICGILHYRFQDVLRKYRARYESVSLDVPNSMVEAQIAKMSATEPESRAGELSNFIEADPEGLFAQEHIRDKPAATLQRILLMRLAGNTFQDIAKVFGIARHTTIASFHDRQLRKLEDYFRKYLC